MKLLIEPPTWLGDSVMASGAIQKILKELKPSKKILIGSFVATELFKEDFDEIIINNKNLNTFKKIPKADIFISFRRSFFSKLIKIFKSKTGFTFSNFSGHMVEQYSKYVNNILNIPDNIYSPKLSFIPKNFNKKVFGINPGASYGSAKRWYTSEFAKVANYLGKFGDIIIFGGKNEIDISKDIEKNLTIKNYQNLCGKLSIKELCETIGGLSGFVTNDSGPMHIAAAYNIPIVAIFGPTDFKETSPFSKNYVIISKKLECSPCKKRECPLKHHNCMKLISAEEVIEKIEKSYIFR